MSEKKTAKPKKESTALGRVLRRWFVAGLIVWLPIAATLVVVRFIVNLLDASLLLIPPFWRPDIPGLGVLLSIVLLIATGAFAANFLGRQALSWAESLLDRIPIVRSVYGGIKKLAETVFADTSVSFRQPILFEYPRKGIWSIGFVTGNPIGEVQNKTAEEVITAFVPTTPNPTSGWIIFLPKKDVIWLDMSVEDAMRLIISLGVVTPDSPSLKRLVEEVSPPADAPAADSTDRSST